MNLYYRCTKIEPIGFGRQHPMAINGIHRGRLYGFFCSDLILGNAEIPTLDDLISVANKLNLDKLINRLKDPDYLKKNNMRQYYIDYVGTNETLTETHKRLLKMYKAKFTSSL